MAAKIKTRNQVTKGPHGGMQLVLIDDVPHLGKQGQVVEVRPGYGRNYLLPNGLAVVPTAHNLRLLEKYKIRVQQAREARIADLKVLASQIAAPDRIITLTENAYEQTEIGPDGIEITKQILYGSVTSADIAKALRAQNLLVDADMVRLEAPLKEAGVLVEVPIHLGFEIETKVKVAIIPATPGAKK